MYLSISDENFELKMRHRDIKKFLMYSTLKFSVIFIQATQEFGRYVRRKLNMIHRDRHSKSKDGYYDPNCFCKYPKN